MPRHALVFAEVALASVLLIGCALMLRSFATLLRVSLRFVAENVVLADYLPLCVPAASIRLGHSITNENPANFSNGKERLFLEEMDPVFGGDAHHVRHVWAVEFGEFLRAWSEENIKAPGRGRDQHPRCLVADIFKSV